MEKKLEELLNFLIQSLKEGKDFALQQIPELFQQIITYNIIYNIILLIFWLVCGYLLLRYGKIWQKIGQDTTSFYKLNDHDAESAFPNKIYRIRLQNISHESEESVYKVIGVISQIVGIAIIALSSVVEISKLIKLWIAPKLWLIEYLKDLLT